MADQIKINKKPDMGNCGECGKYYNKREGAFKDGKMVCMECYKGNIIIEEIMSEFENKLNRLYGICYEEYRGVYDSTDKNLSENDREKANNILKHITRPAKEHFEKELKQHLSSSLLKLIESLEEENNNELASINGQLEYENDEEVREYLIGKRNVFIGQNQTLLSLKETIQNYGK